MKTILFRNNLGEVSIEPLSVQIFPDSAILANRRPFFIPDFDSDWCYAVGIAFRISRLGKSIGTQFAYRYFDAMTLAIHPIPTNISRQIQTTGIEHGILTAFDGALLLGDWIPTPEYGTSFDGSVGDFTFTCSLAALHIAEAIHAISDYTMLKMGDIIIPTLFPHMQPLQVDDKLLGTLHNNECLNFNIK
jgi:hypothetical protein